MFLPYRTDAPVYHFPSVTIGLIVLNVVFFALGLTGTIDTETMVLRYGEFNPIQWFTQVFAHADIVHLLGNMIVLWTFGLVIEGKVGGPKFTVIYLGLAAAHGAIEQLFTLGMSEGGSLGASAVIFGLMGMAMIWAPKNNVDVLYWVWGPLAGTFTMTVQGIAILILAIDFLFQLLFSSLGEHITSQSLHLLGAALGIPLAIWLLKSGEVDCEGWDWFSVRERAV